MSVLNLTDLNLEHRDLFVPPVDDVINGEYEVLFDVLIIKVEKGKISG